MPPAAALLCAATSASVYSLDEFAEAEDDATVVEAVVARDFAGCGSDDDAGDAGAALADKE